MPDDIVKEAGLPDNWEVVDAPVKPNQFMAAPPPPNAMGNYFQGSISPSMQHDAVFVGTEYGSPRVPSVSLMPVSFSGLPQINSAIQSIINSTVTPVVPPAGTGGMNWKGTWLASSTYVEFDVVQFNSSTYLALQTSTNVEPDTSTTDWVLVSENFVYKGVWGASDPLLNPHVNFNDVSGQTSGTSSQAYTRNPSFPTWVANTVTVVGYKLVDSNGNLQVCTTGGTTKGGLHPTWNTTSGGTTTDNTVTWTCGGTAHVIEVGDTLVVMVWCTLSVTSVTDSLGNTYTAMGATNTVTPTIASGASRFSYQPSGIRFFKATAISALVNGSSYSTTAHFTGTASLDIFTFCVSNADLVDQYATTAGAYVDNSIFATYPAPTATVSAVSSELIIAAALLTANAGSPSTPPWTNAGSLSFSIGVSPTGNIGFVQALYQVASPSVNQATWLQGFQNYAYGTVIFGLASTLSRSYLPFDVVQYNGSTYVCVVQTTAVPTNTNFWVLLSQGTGTTLSLTSSYSPGLNDIGKLLTNQSSSSYTVTLPNPPTVNSFWLLVKQSGTGSTIISPNGLTIDGSTSSLTLLPGQSTLIFSDGANYYTAGSTITFKTNSVANGLQNQLNLFAGSNITLTDDGAGKVTISTGTASVNRTAQSANVTATTAYAVGSSGAGLYRITVYMIVSRAATTSSTLPDSRITFTDQDSSAVITIIATTALTGNTTSTFAQAVYEINAKASTNIQYDIGQVTSYASTGGTSMQFAYRLRVEYLG